MSVFTKAGAGIAILAASALVLSGCAAAEEAAPETTDAATEVVEEPTAVVCEEDATKAVDGAYTLKIGTALPLTGTLAFLGPPEEAGVALAIKEINEAGADITIEAVFGDSGDLDNKAYETEVPRVLSEGVAAILGAASSGVSLQFIDQVVGSCVIQFSPANTSPAFTTYEDQGLFGALRLLTFSRVMCWVTCSLKMDTRLSECSF